MGRPKITAPIPDRPYEYWEAIPKPITMFALRKYANELDINRYLSDHNHIIIAAHINMLDGYDNKMEITTVMDDLFTTLKKQETRTTEAKKIIMILYYLEDVYKTMLNYGRPKKTK